MGCLMDFSCHLQMPRCYGTFPWASKKGERNSALPEVRNQIQDTRPEFELSVHQRGSGSDPQIRLRPFSQTPASRTSSEERGVG